MKIKTTFLFIIIYGATFLPWQCRGQLQFGAHVGSTFSFFSKKSELIQGGGPALTAGAVADYELTDRIHLAGGVDYCQSKGSLNYVPSIISSPSGSTIIRTKTGSITIHLIEVSGKVGYQLPIAFLSSISPTVFAGGGLGYAAGTWENYRVTYHSDNSTLEIRGRENVGSILTTTLIPSIDAGLSFQIPLEGEFISAFTVELRAKTSGVGVMRQPSSAQEFRITTFSTAVGFLF